MAPKPVLWIGSGRPPDSDPARRIEVLEPEQALANLPDREYRAIVLDFPLPGWTADSLLHVVRRLAPGTAVLVREAGSREGVTALSAAGTTWCANEEDVLRHLDQAGTTAGLAALAGAVARQDWEDTLVGDSPEMRRLVETIRMVGGRRATVLITGETGTGKEVAARALHLAGPRRRLPFVAVNSSALPAHLLEAELFGHVKGAFTGAIQNRVGRLEQAQRGTLFLDEIGDLPLELQSKLLRVLQEREFQRVGSSENVPFEARVVAATNHDLAREIERGRFREDLYYRLNVVPIDMPPLRRRRGDIPALARHFVRKVCREEGLAAKEIDSAAIDRLRAHDWPGNVRQLENAVEMAVAMSGERCRLTVHDFPLPEPRWPAASELPSFTLPEGGFDYERTLAGLERRIIEQALGRTGGNKKAAADMLGLKRTTLSAKIRSLEAAPGG